MSLAFGSLPREKPCFPHELSSLGIASAPLIGRRAADERAACPLPVAAVCRLALPGPRSGERRARTDRTWLGHRGSARGHRGCLSKTSPSRPGGRRARVRGLVV